MQKIKIGVKEIGPGSPSYIIAEIGSNHDGSLDQALQCIDAAAKAGADAVKFQAFMGPGLLNPYKMNAKGIWESEPVVEILNRLSIPDKWHSVLKEHAKKKNVEYLCTPFDEQKVEVLQSAGIAAYKIASGDLTHRPLLEKIAQTGKPMILSTGMSNLDEVGQALEWIRKAGGSDIVLLHCVGLYPPNPDQLNLRAILTLTKAFDVPVGFSDHSIENTWSLMAVGLGACCLEKHFTLDRNLSGPDHPFAQTPQTFYELVQNIRQLEKVLGSGLKTVALGEESSVIGGRRNLYTTRSLKHGHTLRMEDMKAVRPNIGALLPADLMNCLGCRLNKDLEAHRPIFKTDLE